MIPARESSQRRVTASGALRMLGAVSWKAGTGGLEVSPSFGWALLETSTNDGLLTISDLDRLWNSPERGRDLDEGPTGDLGLNSLVREGTGFLRNIREEKSRHFLHKTAASPGSRRRGRLRYASWPENGHPCENRLFRCVGKVSESLMADSRSSPAPGGAFEKEKILLLSGREAIDHSSIIG